MCVCVCVCVRACVRACMRACVRAWVRAWVCACVHVHAYKLPRTISIDLSYYVTQVFHYCYYELKNMWPISRPLWPWTSEEKTMTAIILYSFHMTRIQGWVALCHPVINIPLPFMWCRYWSRDRGHCWAATTWMWQSVGDICSTSLELNQDPVFWDRHRLLWHCHYEGWRNRERWPIRDAWGICGDLGCEMR